MTAGVPGKWYGARSDRVGTRAYGYELGRIWIPYTSFGPATVATTTDIGTWTGTNADDAEAIQTVMPLPRDLSVIHPITITPFVVFDGVSDDDVFELDLTYELDDGTTDAVHVIPAGTIGVTDAAALTIVEVTHESRLVSSDLAATIAADTFTNAQVEARNFLSFAYTVSLTTMTQAQFILLGVEFTYTKRYF